MITVKFGRNGQAKLDGRVLIAEYPGTQPRCGEIWKVRAVKETPRGTIVRLYWKLVDVPGIGIVDVTDPRASKLPRETMECRQLVEGKLFY